MYGFSEDEQLLVFMDCFGLTRLSRPKQVKTDTAVSGSEASGLASVSADGTLGASYEDLWDKSILWALPQLKSAKRFDRFRERNVIAHPDGLHYLTDEHGSLKIKPASKTVALPLRLDPPRPVKRAASAEVTLELGSGGEELPAIEWGTAQPSAMVSLRLAHDGTLLRFSGGSLICASLDGTKATVHWRRTIRAPEQARLEFFGDRTRTLVLLHLGRRWRVHERSSKGERSFEIDSLAVPTVAGRFLAYQPTAAELVRRDLDSDDEQRFSIDDKHAGMGTIFAGAKGSLLFLPHHRETLVDLIKSAEIPRKLPAKDAEIRQAILAIARRYCEPARLAGVTVELGRVELGHKYNSISITHRIAGGESLFGAMLAGSSQSAWSDVKLPGNWRMGSYGSHGGIGRKSEISRADIIEGVAALTEQGLGFAATIGFWADFLDRDGGPQDTATLSLLAQMLMTVVRDGAKAKLDVQALAERGTPSTDEVLAAFAHYPKRTQELAYETTRLSGRLFNRLLGAEAAQLWRFLYLESKDWDHYGTHYGDLDDYAIAPLLEAHPDTAEVFRTWLRSQQQIPEDRRWYVDRLRERLS